MEISYNKKLSVFLLSEGILFFLIYIGKYDIPCLFEEYFHLPCLGCGMTAAFDALLVGDVVNFIMYNVASPFVLLGLVFLNITTVLDVVKKTYYTIMYLNKMTRHPYILVTIVFILWGINISIYLMR